MAVTAPIGISRDPFWGEYGLLLARERKAKEQEERLRQVTEQARQGTEQESAAALTQLLAGDPELRQRLGLIQETVTMPPAGVRAEQELETRAVQELPVPTTGATRLLNMLQPQLAAREAARVGAAERRVTEKETRGAKTEERAAEGAALADMLDSLVESEGLRPEQTRTAQAWSKGLRSGKINPADVRGPISKLTESVLQPPPAEFQPPEGETDQPFSRYKTTIVVDPQGRQRQTYTTKGPQDYVKDSLDVMNAVNSGQLSPSSPLANQAKSVLDYSRQVSVAPGGQVFPGSEFLFRPPAAPAPVEGGAAAPPAGAPAPAPRGPRAMIERPPQAEELQKYVNVRTLDSAPPGKTLTELQASKDYIVMPAQAINQLPALKSFGTALQEMEKIILKREDTWPKLTENKLKNAAAILKARANFALATGIGKIPYTGVEISPLAGTDAELGRFASMLITRATAVRSFGDVGNLAEVEQAVASEALALHRATSREDALARIDNIRNLINSKLPAGMMWQMTPYKSEAPGQAPAQKAPAAPPSFSDWQKGRK